MINQTLHVYVSDDCWTCRETRRIVADIAPQFPELTIELRAVDQDSPDAVFAVPTYVLDDRVIFLGNPTREALSQKLTAVRQTA
jgi:hypothetical protein